MSPDIVSVQFKQKCLSITSVKIRVITKLPNSEQSYKGKVKTHKYINRQNQSTTGKAFFKSTKQAKRYLLFLKNLSIRDLSVNI